MKLIIIAVFLFIQLEAKETTFAWETIPNAKAYKVRICQNLKCSNILYTSETKDLHLKRNFSPGIYYFSMAAISITGKLGYWSPAKKFIIYPETPKSDEPEEDEKIILDEISPVKFTWSVEEGSKLYSLLVTSSSGQNQIYTTKNNFFEIKLLPGVYYWKIKSHLAKNLAGPYGKPRKLTIIKQKANFIFPRDKNKILIQEGEALTIKWDGKGFTSYDLKISFWKNKQNEIKEINKKNITENQFTINKASLGNYKVSLSGKINTLSFQSAPITFQLTEKFPNENILSINFIAGTPKSSIFETDPAYTGENSTNPSTVASFLFSYSRKIKLIRLSTAFLQSSASKSVTISSIKGDIRYIFSYKNLTISPLIGFQSVRIRGLNQRTNNFRLTPYAQPYLGFALEYFLKSLPNSGFNLEWSFSGFSKSTEANELYLKYMYRLSYRTLLNIGLYAFTLEGKWIPADTMTIENPEGLKKDLKESYAGLSIGISFLF